MDLDRGPLVTLLPRGPRFKSMKPDYLILS
nr:MAG TPA_asm: hypothetical protein [Caudoviricetes sp.]